MTKAVIFDKETGQALVRWPVDARELLRTGKFTQRLPEGFPPFPTERMGGINVIEDKQERGILGGRQRNGPVPEDFDDAEDAEPEPDSEPEPEPVSVAPADRRARADHAAPPTGARRRRGRPRKHPPSPLERVKERAKEIAATEKHRMEQEVRPPETPGEQTPRLVTDAEYGGEPDDAA